jgi:hypothetical protein
MSDVITSNYKHSRQTGIHCGAAIIAMAFYDKRKMPFS